MSFIAAHGRSPATPAVLSVALLMPAALARAEASRPPMVAAQSTHFIFYSHGAPVDVDAVERSLRQVEALLGTRICARAEYYRYRTPQELAAFAGRYAAGVTYASRRQIHSTQPSHLHEMVHLVASQLGDPGPFFQEGLAVALSEGGGRRPREARRLSREMAAHGLTLGGVAAGFDGIEPRLAYAVAGSFVSFLVQARSLPRVVAFFRASAGDGAPEAAFRATFGLSLDEAAAAWRRGTWPAAGGPPVALDKRRARLLESALP